MSNEIPHKVRVIVRNRSEGVCERCKSRHAVEMAHRIPRDVGGHEPSNLGHLCRSCHRWCHDNPKKAYLEGWIVRANSKVKPADLPTIPVRDRNGWVLLFNNGNVRRIPEQTALELLGIHGITPLEVLA